MTMPSVRKIFRADPGTVFWDIDLDSADLRIVTWESDCAWMKEHFKNGRKPYVEVMKEYYKDPTLTKKSDKYPLFKSLCHGTNYLGKAPGMAPKLGLLVSEVERIQKWYFGMCPEIAAWQKKLKNQIDRTMTVSNVWGYSHHFLDRKTENTYNEAVAWIPQSSVGILINHAMVNIDNNLPLVHLLMQVHDSLNGQYPINHPECKEQIVEQSLVPLPYKEPLIIPVGLRTSSVSWGDCQ